MATTSRQTAIFGLEDWRQIYQTYREADFQSYDYETLRKSFIDYLRQNYPESFNDYTESSEFIALLDVIAFMGQALSFRNDLNTRENFIDTAERRDSVVRLASLVGYTPKRNETSQGMLKVLSIRSTENIFDFAGNNLSNIVINWNDTTNVNWLEQFTVILNASLTNAQRFGKPGESKSILGVKTDEYTVNLVPGYLPVVPFNATVDNIGMGFEAISATSINKEYLYELPPRPGAGFNVLYRNDQLGFASENTGFFFMFKQGTLQNYDFNLLERINNRSVAINIEGVNNTDVWLYQLDNNGVIRTMWDQVDSIFSQSASSNNKSVFSITSRTNDQVTLDFGDGIFSTIPIGLFRSYVRASNGLKYIINPEEMQNVEIALSYTSRLGRLETVTFNCGLVVSVSNATPRESIEDIKTRAPSRFYTQNRMVNGEDYTSLPYTLFNSVIKSKAVNRSSIGASRYLELVDITGKYSSTNIFGSDGVIFEETVTPGFNFTFNSLNEIIDVIVNQVEPVLSSRSMQEFYYKNYTRPSLTALGLVWQQSTSVTNETTGYFKYSATGLPASIGSGVSSNRQYLTTGSLVKFTAPTGYFFNNKNQLVIGSPTKVDEKLVVWATISNLLLDGTNYGYGNLSDGTGPVTLNNSVPINAIPTEVIPSLRTDLSIEFETEMRQQVELYKNFGIGYDQLNNEWYIIIDTDLNVDAEYSNNFMKNTDGTGLDASWLVQFITDGVSYTVKYRNLRRYFSSVVETRFFYDNNQNIYDPTTGKVVNDYIKILKINNAPDSLSSLTSDISVDIIDQPVESDGFVDDSKVQISFYDSDFDGVPDNPDYFDDIVASTVSADTKKIFLQRLVDFDNLERYIPAESTAINSEYDTVGDIELVKANFIDKQVFYATSSNRFYILSVDYNGVRTLSVTYEYSVKTGRSGLYFQYKHNSPSSRRIDPGSTNLIDVFLVTTSYYDSYQNYIKDSTGTISEPMPPLLDELTTAYGSLNDYKMISDNLILNSVTFKPLFGSKASESLRAKIKVIKTPGTLVSDSEIKSQVVAKINEYFTIDKWDFGTTFYFSELAAFLHARLGEILGTVVLVPLNSLRAFGDLYEIRSSANEIFVNAATVNDIYVIDALTSEELNSITSTGVV